MSSKSLKYNKNTSSEVKQNSTKSSTNIDSSLTRQDVNYTNLIGSTNIIIANVVRTLQQDIKALAAFGPPLMNITQLVERGTQLEFMANLLYKAFTPVLSSESQVITFGPPISKSPEIAQINSQLALNLKGSEDLFLNITQSLRSCAVSFFKSNSSTASGYYPFIVVNTISWTDTRNQIITNMTALITLLTEMVKLNTSLLSFRK